MFHQEETTDSIQKNYQVILTYACSVSNTLKFFTITLATGLIQGT